ncbi:MAG TPA: hypothetical protein VLC92_11085 [Rhodocyclaceae bacterium]|nr:hypothetical protein [Rhodocyclaceae bacterium]
MALRKGPAYSAEFANTPIRHEDLVVSLSAEDYALFKSVADPRYGADEGAALRDIALTRGHERFLAK